MRIHYPLWSEIVATYWLRHSTDLGLSFDLSLSCKLQLIDLIMVSAACLAGRQTIQVCFLSREQLNGLAGEEKTRQMDGKLEKQIWCPEC